MAREYTVRNRREKTETAPPACEFSPWKQTLLCCLLLTIVVLVFYSPVAHNGFLDYDDNGYITANPQVRAGLTWTTVKWAFTTYDKANWHPLTWLSHALDCELFGLNAAGHHSVNVLLHAANAVLIFLVLQGATGYRWRSLLVAALFALHPMNVESVAWASERKNVLSLLFFLLALWAYVWYTRAPRLGRYVVIVFAYVLALLAKPQVITFPFLLWLWDYWPLRRIGAATSVDPDPAEGGVGRLAGAWVVWEKVPLLLLSGASAVVTMKAQKAGLAVQTLAQCSLPLRLENAVISYVRYLGKALWPAKLAGLYPLPTKLYPAWQVAASVVLLLLITALVLRAHRQRYLVVGWFWFLGSLVPMIGLVQVGVQSMADRYAYLPFIGLFVMATWLLADWDETRRLAASVVVVPAVCCLLAFGMLTHRQVGYWRSIPSFWQHTLEVTQDNYVAQVKLGTFLLGEGKADEAANHFRAALDAYPEGVSAHLSLGTYEDERGNLSAAIEHYRVAALHATDAGTRATAYTSLGFAYRGAGQPTKAKECFEAALQAAPDRARAITGLALIAQGDGNLEEAVRQYSRALAVQPTDVGYLLLAQALQRNGHLEEANAISARVVNSSPNLAEAQKAAEQFLSAR